MRDREKEREREREREREAETQAEGDAGSMQGARCETRSRVYRVTPWAKGRCSTTEPPSCPLRPFQLEILQWVHVPGTTVLCVL